MSITPRVTRRLYERMQLAPDVKRRTSVPKFDGATPGPDPSGAQPPKYPPSLPSLAPRPLPPFPLSPDTIFIPSSLPTSLLPVFRQTFPDLTPIIGEEVDEFLTVEYLYWNIDVISTTGEDTTGVSLRRETSPIYIYISLCLSGLSVFYANVQKRVRKKNRSSEDCSAIVTMLKLSRGRLVFFLLLLLHPFLSHFLSFPSLSFAVAHGRISMRDVAGFPSRNSLTPVFE